MENFYEILEVDNFSNYESIKLSYKRLIKLAHPDKGGSQEKFELVKKAYEILKSEDNRQIYDQQLKYIMHEIEMAENIDIEVESSNIAYTCEQCFFLNKEENRKVLKIKKNKFQKELFLTKCYGCSKSYKYEL